MYSNIDDLISSKERKVLITGAAGNLGRLISKTLASIGYELILVDFESEEFYKLIEEIKSQSEVEIEYFFCDLEIESERDQLILNIKRKYSEINCLINNAAFVGTRNLDGWNVPFEEQSIKTWRRCFEVNLTTPFHLSQSLTPIMSKAKNPTIINVGSIYGHYAPDWNLYEGTEINNIAAYAGSKGGLIQMTKWLSTTLAPKIRVNAISPGGILRNQSKDFIVKYSSKVPLQRMAKEQDLMGAFIFLATDMSLYITGQTIKVDGGWGIS